MRSRRCGFAAICQAGLAGRRRVASAMKSAWRDLALLLLGGTACFDAEVPTAALPLGLSAIRIASGVDVLDHWVTHG